MNKTIPEGHPKPLTIDSPQITKLEQKLRESLELRVQNIPSPISNCPLTLNNNTEVKIAILFSGGLDCTILARLCNDILPINEPIDLLNVAFENPRVAAAAATKTKTNSNYSVYEECPDRKTGRAAYKELQRISPDRNWQFIAINIPYTETESQRNEIKRLMRPHNTEMDLSIACALYFASRGWGTTTSPTQSQYSTTARVLLSGLGADELFAGYSRHGIAFSRNGFKGLIDEIDLDVSRISKRNLGRDDRVISNWGREVRYPYLDEDFMAWVLEVPVWVKCGFGWSKSSYASSTARDSSSAERDSSTTPKDDNGEIEPGKIALRLLALKLGMNHVAREKKRAIQFGSRTAKMEKGRSKGTEILS